MATRAGKPLPLDEVKVLLERLEQVATREACWSCECLQGFITQLELDATEDVRSLLQTYEVREEHLHGGLGCQPCPPADVFSQYLRGF